MALDLEQAVTRFEDNETRLDTFINGDATDSVTTRGGASYPSLAKWLSDNSAFLATLDKRTPLRLTTIGGTANAIVATAPGISGAAHVTGRLYILQPSAANTVAEPTLSINGETAAPVRYENNVAILANDLGAGAQYLVEFVSNHFVVIGLLSTDRAALTSQKARSVPYGNASGTGNVQVVNTTDAPQIYVVNKTVVMFRSAGTNSETDPTINVNGIGPLPIKGPGTTSLDPNDIQQGRVYGALFANTYWVVIAGELGRSAKAIDADVATKAPQNSPVFTGNPTAPTQLPGDNSNRLANTAFVKAALTALINSAPGALDTLKELADALGDDPNFATTVINTITAETNRALSVEKALSEDVSGVRTVLVNVGGSANDITADAPGVANPNRAGNRFVLYPVAAATGPCTLTLKGSSGAASTTLPLRDISGKVFVGGEWQVGSGQDMLVVAATGTQFRVTSVIPVDRTKLAAAETNITTLSKDLGRDLAAQVQTIGRDAQYALVSGTGALGAGPYVWGLLVVLFDSWARRFRFWARDTGTVYLLICELRDDILPGYVRVIDYRTFAVATTGLKDFTGAALGDIALKAGQVLGIYGPGIVAFDGNPGDSGGYLNAGSDVFQFVDTTYATNTRIQAGIELVPAQVSAPQMREAIRTAARAPDGVIIKTIGRPAIFTPVTGSAIAARIYAFAEPASSDIVLDNLSFFALAGGIVTLFALAKSGDTFTMTRKASFMNTTAGLRNFDKDGVPAFVLKDGERLGVYAPGVVAYTTALGDCGGFYNSTGYTEAPWDDTDVTTSVRIQFSARFRKASAADLSVERLRALIPTAGGTPAVPTSYILVWIDGQSNGSGRPQPVTNAFSFPAGVAYKYDRASNSLMAMADPTGNDITKNPGGSMGPALADTIWRKFGYGTIFVNSCDGQTRVNVDWGADKPSWLQAAADWDAVLPLIHAARLPVIGTVGVIVEGETDADGSTDPDAYEAGMIDLGARMGAKTGLGSKLPIIICQLGRLQGSDPANYQTLRARQSKMVREQSNFFFGWTGAQNLPARGLMYDNIHWGQQGLNECGMSTADVAVARGAGLLPAGLDGPA